MSENTQREDWDRVEQKIKQMLVISCGKIRSTIIDYVKDAWNVGTLNAKSIIEKVREDMVTEYVFSQMNMDEEWLEANNLVPLKIVKKKFDNRRK